MAIKIGDWSLNPWGLFRAAVAVAYCLGGLFVLADLDGKYGWHQSYRVGIWSVAVWAYASKWRHAFVDILWAFSGVALGLAYLLAISPGTTAEFPNNAELIAGQAALSTLAFGIALHLLLAVWGWHQDRARLKASSKSALDRAAGGF
jgi:hypothetical protein